MIFGTLSINTNCNIELSAVSVSLKQPMSFITKCRILNFPAVSGLNLMFGVVSLKTPVPKSHIYLIIRRSFKATMVLSDKLTESLKQCVVKILSFVLGGSETVKINDKSCSPLHPSNVGLLAITWIKY